MSVRIITGDCRKVLRELPDESVHCVVTSPPYWGLRDYGVEGQMGMEICLGDHVDGMTEVFAEVRRVLRKDGTLWLNYGDSYAASVNGRAAADIVDDDRTFRDKPFSTVGPIFRPGNPDKNGGRSNRNGLSVDAASMLKPKDLCGIPWRVAFALQADGWYLRQDIIWSKPNPMPESVRDRCTKAHEYIFLLSKSQRYYFDQDAIRQKPTGWTNPIRSFSKGSLGKNHTPNYQLDGLLGANKRSVWEISTEPYSEAHFATFPPALIEPCILAGCPKGGTVLDPFGGAGTTGLVADRLGRNAILIELNPEYVEMAERRIRGDAPMFAEVELRA